MKHKMNKINTIIREYFRNNKIKLKDVAQLLNTSQSNLSERLNSKRSITLDEFFTLYGYYGDNFAITVMEHYGSRMLFLEQIKELITITNQLKPIYNEVREKNEKVFQLLGGIEKGIDAFSIYSNGTNS
jgi:transcriptional regulator with XRE-family HTH domain